MKLHLFLLASLASSAASFSVGSSHSRLASTTTSLNMFSGAGEGVPNEDDPEEIAKMEAAAKQMGMSVGEYKLGITARMRLVKQLDDARVSGGDKSKVYVERDGNNPPKVMEITITEEGKALGKDVVSAELVSALKTASDNSRNTRTSAQKDMMAWIGDEMKKVGGS